MEKRKKIPFWVQIVAIILAGVIVSLSITMYFNDKNAERFTVTFAYGDGTIIEEKQVKAGKGVFPPIIETDDVFRGWNVAINSVTQNIEAQPIIYNIIEDNLFYFDSVYVKEGEKFNLNLFVSGNVNVSSGELWIEYDPNVLEYKKSNGLGLSKINSEKERLVVKFDCDTILSEKTELANITFLALKKDVYATQVNVICKRSDLITDGGEIVVDNATINNKIYFLQEEG